MIIKSIELENFKSHLNTKVDLDTGISIIMGENGAGKSSILESISFALFKEYTSKKMDKLINNDKNKMQVNVEFISNGRTYRVLRRRKRNSTPESMLYVKDNDKFSLIQKGDAAVTDEIERIISLDKNLFLNAVYVRQGEIANLITKNPSEKKEMMGRLLGVADLENSWKNMKFLIDDYKAQEIRIKGKLDNFKKVEGDLKDKEIKRDELNNLLKEMDLELTEKENKLKKLRIIKEFFDKKENDYDLINQKIEHEKNMINGLITNKAELSKKSSEIIIKEKEIVKLEPEISKIKVLDDLKDKITILKGLETDKDYIKKTLTKIDGIKNILTANEENHDKFKDLTIEIEKLTKERKQFEGSDILKNNYENTARETSVEIKKIEKIISSKLEEYEKILCTETSSIEELELLWQTRKDDLKKKIKQNHHQINEFNSKISDINGQNREIKKAINELEKAGNKCPVCESNLEENKRENLLEKYKYEVEKNNGLISSFEQNLSILISDKKFLEESSNKFDEMNIYGLKKDSVDLKNKIEKINKIRPELEKISESVKSLNYIDSKLNEKKDLKNQLEINYKKYIGAENYLKSTESSEQLLNSFEKIKKEIKPLNDEISILSEKVRIKPDEVNMALENLRNLKEVFDKLQGEISNKEEISMSLSKVKLEIQDHSKEMGKLKEDIVEIGYEKEKHNLARQKLDICQKEFEKLQNKIGSLKGQLDIICERVTELKMEINEYAEDKKELERLSRFIELLNEIRKLYGKDGLQKDLRNKSRPLIEKNTLDFFNKFNFEYSDINLNEDYDVTLFGPSGENTLDMISGGEIIAVAIALRLGIAKTLVRGNLELMILDEPTVHLDSYRRQELIDVIKKLSVIPQMIIVTHDPGLEEAADNILRIEKENGISGVASL